MLIRLDRYSRDQTSAVEFWKLRVILIDKSLIGSREFCQMLRRANRTSDKFTGAIWTGRGKVLLRTILAKCAFETAYASLRVVRWQIDTATLAIWF